MRATHVCALLVGVVLTTSCQSSSLYTWGEYEDSVYDVCSPEGEADLGQQVAALTELIDQAGQSQRGVPPGVHAHLGYLLYLQGDVEGAVAGFTAEKVAYPESTAFVDGLLGRLRASGETTAAEGS